LKKDARCGQRAYNSGKFLRKLVGRVPSHGGGAAAFNGFYQADG